MTKHDADEVIGRITTRGAWDRRYRVRYEDEDFLKLRSVRSVEPDVSLFRQIVNIIALSLFVIVLFGSIIAMGAILAVTYPQPGGFR
jgi:hypothetical protein